MQKDYVIKHKTIQKRQLVPRKNNVKTRKRGSPSKDERDNT